MESAQILAQVSTEEDVPHDWLVFTLLRQKVLLGIVGWIVGALMGGTLFAFMAPIMIPHNYQLGVAAAIFSTILLAVVLYVCLGSLWAIVVDIQRLRHADRHMIIITPTDFVKQEGRRVVHVPLEYVQYVTARGTPPVDRSLEGARQDTRAGNMSEGMGGLFFGRRGMRRKRSRTPNTLAFVDSRSDAEVIVTTDQAYGDPFYIAAHLKKYADARLQNMH
jgi:hypothetical protein